MQNPRVPTPPATSDFGPAQRGRGVTHLSLRPRSAVPPPPPDGALPALHVLLDADATAERLRGRLAREATIEQVEPRQIAYIPGESCEVQWRVWVDGQPTAAVTRITSLTGTGQPDVWWYPHDPAMPALANPAEVLARMGHPGEDMSDVQDLAYRPGVRAVRRVGSVVLKWYGDEGTHRHACTASTWASDRLGDRTPALIGSDPLSRCTMQQRIDGAPVTRIGSLELGPAAGRLLREIHGGPPRGINARITPTDVLRRTLRVAHLLATIRPDLAERLVRIVKTLTDGMPEPPAPVPVHGDFNASQLLRRHDGTLAVLDFDELCLSAPALDIAGFAANVAGGRRDDGAQVAHALASILDGYGARPQALSWWLAAALLGRARSAFRLQKSKWPVRVEAGVALTEDVLAA